MGKKLEKDRACVKPGEGGLFIDDVKVENKTEEQKTQQDHMKDKPVKEHK